MIKKILLGSSIIVLCSFGLVTHFQDLVLEKLTDYSKNYPEKIYVQTDKPYYTIDDDIWYAAYLVNGITHKKSKKSKIIHVELINDKDSIVLHDKLYTDDLSAAGEFKIGKEWKPGNYLLRAYTNYMRNSSPDYFFKKQIPIWNLKKDNVLSKLDLVREDNREDSPNKIAATDRPDLNFYPEGGYLINGIQSKIAIKVKNEKYKNAYIEGVVKDSNNKAVSAFKIFEFGLGALTFTPQVNETYYACIVNNGKEEKYKLPKALPKGFSLNLLNRGSEITLKVAAVNDIGLKNAFIIAHQRGEVIFQKLIETTVGKLTVKLNTAEFNSGITHITLFNNNGKPVCERLVFIDNVQNDITIDIDKKEGILKTREKVTLQLSLKDGKGNPASGNISLAINDAQSIQKNHNDETIKTYLLLNSDLRGEIENPGYFFEKGKETKRRFLLDLVMLTNGWSRFIWDDLLYSPPKAIDKYETEKGLYVKGQTQSLKDRTKFIPAATRFTILKSGEVPFQESKLSDQNGQFKYGPYVFYDSVPMLVEARIKGFKNSSNKNKDVHISIRKNIYKSPKITRVNLAKKSKVDRGIAINFLEQAISSYRIDTAYANSAQRLKEIVITAKKETEKEERKKKLDSFTDYGSPSRRLDLNDVVGGESLGILNLLRRLTGVFVTNTTITVRGGTPRILLDDFPVEFEDISYLSGSDIEFIDLLTGASASIIRGGGNGGVIAIYTKRGVGNIKNTSPEPGIISFQLPGFDTPRKFYSPDYADSFYDTSKPDFRTTLHWNPKIVITKDAKAEVSFFTSDSKTDYFIEVEGITHEGIPIYHSSIFEVE